MQVKWCFSRSPKHVTWYITWLFFDGSNVLKCKVSLQYLSGYHTTIPDTYEVWDSYIPCILCWTSTSSWLCGIVPFWQALSCWGWTSCDSPPSYILQNHHDGSRTLVLQDHYHQWYRQCSQPAANEVIIERFTPPVPVPGNFELDHMVPLNNHQICLQAFEALRLILWFNSYSGNNVLKCKIIKCHHKNYITWYVPTQISTHKGRSWTFSASSNSRMFSWSIASSHAIYMQRQ